MRKTYGLLERGREYWREAEREREREGQTHKPRRVTHEANSVYLMSHKSSRSIAHCRNGVRDGSTVSLIH